MFFTLTEHLKNLVRSILVMQYNLMSTSSERTLLIVTPRYLILFTNSTCWLFTVRLRPVVLKNLQGKYIALVFLQLKTIAYCALRQIQRKYQQAFETRSKAANVISVHKII